MLNFGRPIVKCTPHMVGLFLCIVDDDASLSQPLYSTFSIESPPGERTRHMKASQLQQASNPLSGMITYLGQGPRVIGVPRTCLHYE